MHTIHITANWKRIMRWLYGMLFKIGWGSSRRKNYIENTFFFIITRFNFFPRQFKIEIQNCIANMVYFSTPINKDKMKKVNNSHEKNENMHDGVNIFSIFYK